MYFFLKRSNLDVHLRTLRYPSLRLDNDDNLYKNLHHLTVERTWFGWAFYRRKDWKCGSHLLQEGYWSGDHSSTAWRRIRILKYSHIFQRAHLRPNSINVSFRSSPGFKRQRSAIVMLILPTPDCGKTSILIRIGWAMLNNKWCTHSSSMSWPVFRLLVEFTNEERAPKFSVDMIENSNCEPSSLSRVSSTVCQILLADCRLDYC